MGIATGPASRGAVGIRDPGNALAPWGVGGFGDGLDVMPVRSKVDRVNVVDIDAKFHAVTGRGPLRASVGRLCRYAAQTDLRGLADAVPSIPVFPVGETSPVGGTSYGDRNRVPRRLTTKIRNASNGDRRPGQHGSAIQRQPTSGSAEQLAV